MRNLILLILLLLLGLGGGYFWYQLKEAPEERALQCFLEKDWEGARSHISRKQSAKRHPFSVYSAIILCAKGQFAESDHLLNQLHKISLTDKHQDLVRHIQYLNAALTSDVDRLKALLEESNEDCLNEFELFFSGYCDYLQGAFESAVHKWEQVSQIAFTSLDIGPWVSALFEQFFSLQAREIYFAHALIELSQFEQAHAFLEKNCFSSVDSNSSSFQRLSAHLLALNHVLEGLTLTPHERDSHFKLAQYYFQRTAKTNKNVFASSRLQHHMIIAIKQLTKNLDDDCAVKWAFEWIKLMQLWGQHLAIDQISMDLTQKIQKLPHKQQDHFLKKYVNTFSQSPAHLALISGLKNAFEEALSNRDVAALQKYADLLILADCGQEIIQDLYSSSSSALSMFIESQDSKMDSVANLVKLWDSLPLDQRYHSLYCHLLMQHAQNCWQKEGFEDHGLYLMKLALSCTKERQQMRHQIEQFLLPLYENAEANNTLGRLSKVHDALDFFNIQPNQLTCSEKIANHLEDAHFLFLSKNWISAKTHANWVLKMDPENSKARRIAGLSAFYLGEHSTAYHLLSPLQEKDKAVCYALAFSTPYLDMNAQEEGSSIVQVELCDPYGDN